MDVSIYNNGNITKDVISEKLTDSIWRITDILNREPFDVAIRHVYLAIRDSHFPECDGFISSFDQGALELLTFEKRVKHTHSHMNNIFGYTIRENSIYISNQAEQDNNVSLSPNHLHIKRVITVPMKHQRIVGIICMANKTTDFTLEDAQILAGISKIVSVYMWNYLEVKMRYISVIHKLCTSIRTPMMSISGSIDILKRTFSKPEKDVSHILSIIDMSSQNIVTILEDIVYYSELAANKFIIKNTNFKVSELISETVYEIKEKKNDIVINNRLTQDYILTDRRLLKYILSVLLNNANTYTENGNIRVTVNLSPFEGSSSDYRDSTLQIQIEDSGVGIPFQDQNLVFDEFYRGNVTEENQYSSGLKLPICKRICNRLNGDIVVSSNLHKGTCFTFTVNVRVTPDINYILEQYGSQLRRGTVLVIQNNVESRLNIYNSYISFGIPVYLCSSLRDVYEFSRLHEVSLLITDTTDIEATKYELSIREMNYPICTTHIKHMSTTTRDENSYYLDTRNFDKVDLLLMTQSAIKSRENSLIISSKNGPTDRSILVVEDGPDNLYILIQLLNILGYSNIDTAKDGGEALNLLLRKSYDIVLIDNIMPGMTGIEVAVEFGNLCKEPLTNFAIISAGITDSDIATLHSVGVIHTLMKPYGLEELRILLSNI